MARSSPVHLPGGLGRPLTFVTGECPRVPLFPALAAHGVSLLHILPDLPPRYPVYGPGNTALGSMYWPWGLIMVPGVPLGRSWDPDSYLSPVGAADAPPTAESQVGLVHWLAVGFVVPERDHQHLLRADPRTTLMPERGTLNGPGPAESGTPLPSRLHRDTYFLPWRDSLIPFERAPSTGHPRSPIPIKGPEVLNLPVPLLSPVFVGSTLGPLAWHKKQEECKAT